MNRRAFLGNLATATAAASVSRLTAFSSSPTARTIIHFIGMVGFVKRSDGSLLAATPGATRLGHLQHASFVMARAGTRSASAFGLRFEPGVVPGAFDPTLAAARPKDFVFRCVGNVAFEARSDGDPAVENHAPQLAQMRRIAPGKRLRGDLAKWATTTMALQGGRIVSESVHPDADKVWKFGEIHRQLLTDAVRYEAPRVTIRMFAASEIRTLTASADEPVEFWVVSAPAMRNSENDPRRPVHGALLFQYLADATPIIPECAEAKGAVSRETRLPCALSSVASLNSIAVAPMPWYPEICYGGYFESA